MQRNRCTVLSGWMGDRSRFMTPVNVFPSFETILKYWLEPARSVAYQALPMVQPSRSEKVAFALAVAIACCVLVVMTSSSVLAETEEPVAQIRAGFHDQQDAWNRGDIDGFMNGYARSGSTVFISEDKVTRGWETVRDRYTQKYSSRA